MGRQAKDTVGVNVGTKMVDGKLTDDIREVMPVRSFALNELTKEQVTELLLQSLKIREGSMIRQRAKKLIPKLQHNQKVLADMESIPGMTKEMLDIFKRNPEYSTEIPGQMQFGISDYFSVDAEEEETPEPEVKEEKKGKGKK